MHLNIYKWLRWLIAIGLLTLLLCWLQSSNGLNVQAQGSSVPATYYGEIQPMASVLEFTPVAGMLVQAKINESLCGQSFTQNQNGQIIYVVHVLASTQSGGLENCGTEGRTIRFYVGQYLMTQNAEWDNSQAWSLTLSPQQNATPLPEPLPSLTPTATSTSTDSPTPTNTPPATNTNTPLPNPTAEPTIAPTNTPTVSNTPLPNPTEAPTTASINTPMVSNTPLPNPTAGSTTIMEPTSASTVTTPTLEPTIGDDLPLPTSATLVPTDIPQPAATSEPVETEPSEDTITPTLAFDPYTAGAAGSHFLLIGTEFSLAQMITLSINGQQVLTDIQIDATGGFSVTIASAESLETGPYVVTISEYPEHSASFVISPIFPKHELIESLYVIRFPLDDELDKDTDPIANDPVGSDNELEQQVHLLYLPFTQRE